MKKLLKLFFCTLGVIFFLILCALAYLWFADPFGIRPIVVKYLEKDTPITVEGVLSETQTLLDANPALNSTQEAALRTVGIDPGTLPTSVTPEMKVCFTEKLGAERVSAIVAGDTPTAVEIFQTKDCYQ